MHLRITLIICISKDAGAALRVAHWINLLMRKLVVGDLGAEPATDCNLTLYVVLEIIEGNHVFHAILEVMATSLHVTTDSSSARVAESRVRRCRGQHTLCLVLMLLLKWTEVVK